MYIDITISIAKLYAIFMSVLAHNTVLHHLLLGYPVKLKLFSQKCILAKDVIQNLLKYSRQYNFSTLTKLSSSVLSKNLTTYGNLQNLTDA